MQLLSRYNHLGRMSTLTIRPQSNVMKKVAKQVYLSARNFILEPVKDTDVKIAACDSEGKTKGSPLSDTELPNTFAFLSCRKNSRPSEISIPLTSSLPSIDSPSFFNIFEEKIVFCTKIAKYNDNESLSFITQTMQELLTFVKTQQLSNLDNYKLKQITDFLFLFAFRDTIEVSQSYWFSDDPVVYSDATWAYLSIVYQILLIIFCHFPSYPFFDKEFFSNLVSHFPAPDLNERNQLSSLAIRWMESHKTTIKPFEAHLQDYLTGDQTPFAAIPSLSCIQSIIEKGIVEYSSIYKQTILPLFGAPHFMSYHQNLYPIVDKFTDLKMKGFDNVLPTIQALVYHWPKTRSSKQIVFINWIILMLERSNDLLRDQMKEVFKILTNCLLSQNAKVADTAFCFLKNSNIESWVVHYSNIVYPILINAIINNPDPKRGEATIQYHTRIIDELKRISGSRYREHLKSKTTPNSDLIRTWVSIAREAKKRNTKLNLAPKLSEIQKIFGIIEMTQ